MLNIKATIDFYDRQSRSCVSYYRNAKTDEARLKYSILADLYFALASGISILTVGHSINEGPVPHTTQLPDLESVDKPHEL